eukprot:gene9435-10420_t
MKIYDWGDTMAKMWIPRAFHLLFGTLLALSRSTTCSKILVFPLDIVPTNQHFNDMVNLSSILAENGHDVMLLVNTLNKPRYELPENLTLFTYSIPDDSTNLLKESTSEHNNKDRLYYDSHISSKLCEGLLRTKYISMQWKFEGFELFITDFSNICSRIIMDYLRLPTILWCGSHIELQPNITWSDVRLNANYPKLLRRIIKTVNLISHMFNRSFYLSAPFDEIKSKYGFNKTLSVADSISRAKPLVFYNIDPSYDMPMSLMPYVIPVAGIFSKDPSPLSDDAENFVQTAKSHIGFIFVNIRSISQVIDHTRSAMLAGVLSTVQQNVVWKSPELLGDIVPPNAQFFPNLDENDVIAHSGLRFLITDCNLRSLQHAVKHAVPVFGMPLFANQMANCANIVQRHGIGEVLDANNASQKQIKAAIKKMLTNAVYKQNSIKLSEIANTQLVSPKQTLLFWIDYIIKFKGVAHLYDDEADTLAWYSYYNHDIIAFLTTENVSGCKMKENNGENTVAKYAQLVACKTEKIRELIGEQIFPFVVCGTSLKSTLVSSKDSDVGTLGNLLSDIAEAIQDTTTSPIVSSGAVALITEKLYVRGCKEGDPVYYTVHAAIKWSGRRTTAGHYTAFIREYEDWTIQLLRKDCSASEELPMSLLKITPEAQNDMEFILKDQGCMCHNTALIMVDSNDLRNAMKGGVISSAIMDAFFQRISRNLEPVLCVNSFAFPCILTKQTERGALQAILKRDDLTKFKAVIVPIHLRGNEVDHFGLPLMVRIPFLVPLKCNQPLKYNQSPEQQPGALRCFISAGSPALPPSRSRVVGAICLFLLEVYPQPVTELTYSGRRRTINRWPSILVAYNRIRARWSLPGATETADEPLLEPRKRPRIVSLAPPMELKEPEDCSGQAKIRRRGVQKTVLPVSVPSTAIVAVAVAAPLDDQDPVPGTPQVQPAPQVQPVSRTTAWSNKGKAGATKVLKVFSCSVCQVPADHADHGHYYGQSRHCPLRPGAPTKEEWLRQAMSERKQKKKKKEKQL